jgi:hypothetical protein
MIGTRKLRTGEGELGILIFVGGIIVVAFLFFKPEVFRTAVQVPVSVSIRDSIVGIGNVVQITNTSNTTLTGVIVTGRNSGMNQSLSYEIQSLGPRQNTEVGWMEWGWKVAANETITVSASGYLPIVFTSAQLGVR